MEPKNTFKITEESYKNGSFIPLLKGDHNYRIEMSKSAIADMPTDYEYLKNMGIYKLCETIDPNKVAIMLKNDIITLSKADTYSRWCAFNICFSLVYSEKHYRAPFYLLDDELINIIYQSIHQVENELKKLHIYIGKELKDGLWTDICSSAEIIEQKFNIKFL